MNKYYSVMRPVSIGTYPKNGAVNIVNFEDRKFCKEINGEAWGYIEYDRFLTDAELNDYELKKGRRESQ